MEHFDEQEKETKEEETTNQTWNRWNSELDSQSYWPSSEFNCVVFLNRNKRKQKKEKATKENAIRIKLKDIKGIQN